MQVLAMQAFTLVGCALGADRTDKEIAMYKEATRSDPTLADGYYNLGLLLHDAGRPHNPNA